MSTFRPGTPASVYGPINKRLYGTPLPANGGRAVTTGSAGVPRLPPMLPNIAQVSPGVVAPGVLPPPLNPTPAAPTFSGVAVGSYPTPPPGPQPSSYQQWWLQNRNPIGAATGMPAQPTGGAGARIKGQPIGGLTGGSYLPPMLGQPSFGSLQGTPGGTLTNPFPMPPAVPATPPPDAPLGVGVPPPSVQVGPGGVHGALRTPQNESFLGGLAKAARSRRYGM